jgi:hypothetical protein
MLILAFTLLQGCFAHRAVAGPVQVSPCTAERAVIASATYADATTRAVRGYLGCIAKLDAAPVDLPEIVRGELERNPYPASHRVDVWAWFFDLEQIKELPKTVPELENAIRRLQDQALAREAMGEDDLAAAARTRATRLESLKVALASLEG